MSYEYQIVIKNSNSSNALAARNIFNSIKNGKHKNIRSKGNRIFFQDSAALDFEMPACQLVLRDDLLFIQINIKSKEVYDVLSSELKNYDTHFAEEDDDEIFTLKEIFGITKPQQRTLNE